MAVGRVVWVALEEVKVEVIRAEAEGIRVEEEAGMFGSAERKTPRSLWLKILHMATKLLMRSGNRLLRKLGTSKG